MSFASSLEWKAWSYVDKGLVEHPYYVTYLYVMLYVVIVVVVTGASDGIGKGYALEVSRYVMTLKQPIILHILH